MKEINKRDIILIIALILIAIIVSIIIIVPKSDNKNNETNNQNNNGPIVLNHAPDKPASPDDLEKIPIDANLLT